MPFLICLGASPVQLCEDLGQVQTMRILYLLFPFILLLVQGAAGSSLAPRNKEKCHREKGFCGFLKCSFPFIISGKCSRFFFC
uniref:Beta-defensin-like domain-containing protein n=1 Tax=Anas zonorhyncha TaxID=75864 RepID=A0A8B9VJ67_9AVES